VYGELVFYRYLATIQIFLILTGLGGLALLVNWAAARLRGRGAA